MISPICKKCGNELHEFGAIILSPIDADDTALKTHICIPCYGAILPDANKGEGYAVMLSPPDKNDRVKLSALSEGLYKSIIAEH